MTTGAVFHIRVDLPLERADLMIRVLIADDQALIRAGFAALISSAPDLEVVGEAIDGADALRQCVGADAPTSCSWTSGCRSSTACRRPRRSAPTPTSPACTC